MFNIFKIVQTTIYGILLILITIWIVLNIIEGNISSVPYFMITILFLSLIIWLFISLIKDKNE